jgi:hypothetical protein
MVLSFNEWAKNKESVLEEGLNDVQQMGDYYVKEFNSPGTGQAGLQVHEVRGRREGVIYFTGG